MKYIAGLIFLTSACGPLTENKTSDGSAPTEESAAPSTVDAATADTTATAIADTAGAGGANPDISVTTNSNSLTAARSRGVWIYGAGAWIGDPAHVDRLISLMLK